MNTFNNNEDNENKIVCSEHMQNAIKMLLSAHSKDIMKVESEFQNQKKIWDQEKATLVTAYKRLKEKNEALKKIIKDSGIKIDNNSINGNSNSNTLDNSNSNSKLNNVNSTNSSPSTPKNNKNIDSNDNFSSGSDSESNLKNEFQTKKKNVQKPQPDSIKDQNDKNNKPKKKRKSNEPSLSVQDDLDLPLTNQNHSKEEEELLFLSQQQQQTTTTTTTTLLSTKFGTSTNQAKSPSSQPSLTTTTPPASNAKSKKYKYSEVVRNQAEREQMEGFECRHCKEFYDAVLGENFDKKILLNQCSRHRHDETPPSTPPGFWDFGFGDSPLKKS